MVVNEFIAYEQLGKGITEAKFIDQHRTVTILTYALCGFANFASIGIQIGGIGAIAPERRGDLAKLGFRAMLGGTLAAFMTACVAGVLYFPPEQDQPQDEHPVPVSQAAVSPIPSVCKSACYTTQTGGMHGKLPHRFPTLPCGLQCDIMSVSRQPPLLPHYETYG